MSTRYTPDTHKEIKPISSHATALNNKNQIDGTLLSKNRKILRWVWIVASCLSVVGATVVGLLFNETSWLDADGSLHEPLFGLIPVSYLFFFLAILLGLADAALTLRTRKMRR